MSPLERDQIKQRIYNLRVYIFRASRQLNAANWSGAYLAALQVLSNDRNITVLEAAKLVYDVAVEPRKVEINLLRAKLGELPSKKDDFENIVILPARRAHKG